MLYQLNQAGCTEFCASLTTVCHVAYIRNSMLLVQTRPTMLKQLQHSLAISPAVHYCSLTMHCPQLATLAIYTPIDTCGDSALFLAVKCTKLEFILCMV